MHTCLPEELQSRIYFFGIWEPQITAFIHERLAPGDTFIDVGANIGYYTLMAASLVGNTGRVLAVEASPSIFKKLQGNISLNKFENINVFNEAASDRPGFLNIFLGSDLELGETTTVESEANIKGYSIECKVPANTLEKIVGKDAILNARLIKIDVEGAEASVIAGIRELIQQCSKETEFVVEITPRAINSQGGTVEEVIDLFRKADYKLYIIPNDYRDLSFFPIKNQYELADLREIPDGQFDLVASKLLSNVAGAVSNAV